MKPLYFIFAVFSGLLLSMLLSLCFGLYSIGKYSQIIEYKVALVENLDNLERTGKQLESMYYYLRDNPAALEQEVNRIGMLYPGEYMMQRELRERSLQALSPGERLVYRPPDIGNKALVRVVSLSFSLIVFFLLLFMDQGYRRENFMRPRRDDREDESPGQVGSDLEMAQSIRIQVATRE